MFSYLRNIFPKVLAATDRDFQTDKGKVKQKYYLPLGKVTIDLRKFY